MQNYNQNFNVNFNEKFNQNYNNTDNSQNNQFAQLQQQFAQLQSQLQSQLQYQSNTNQIITNINNEPKNPIDYIRFKGLDSSSKRFNIKDNPFRIRLKPHQESLVYRALEIDEKGIGSSLPFGVFSDKPGAGKTFVALALIYYSKVFFNSQGVNVIVVPHNIYTQWIDAINNFLGRTMTYKCLLEYTEITSLFSNQEMLYKYDIIITTPLNYGVFASTVNSMGLKVRRVFFDEADTMKNLLVDAINSGFTWFISASIQRVFDSNTLKAKIGIYDLFLPELLQNECFCKKEFIDEAMKLPDPKEEKFICRDFFLDNILVNILDKNQLELINAHDYTEIRSECDGFQIKNTKEITRQIYYYSRRVVNEQEEILKDLEKKLKFPNREEYNRVVETKMKVEQKRDRYLNIYLQIKMLSERNNICVECWENIIENNNLSNKIKIFRSECNDIICQNCFSKIEEKYKCIGCKNPHSKESYKTENIEISDNMIKNFMKSKINKFVILDKIIEVTGEKVLIYTKHRGISNYLKNLSYKLGFNYGELYGGNIKQIDSVLRDFKHNPDLKILLIDDSYFGVGLNIEYATDFIFVHKVDKEIKKQLLGRAQRFGRMKSLNIWELIYQNEK